MVAWVVTWAAALAAACAAPRYDRGKSADVARPGFARPVAAPQPAGNPYTPAKAALGRALFFDPRLSADGRVACATCHDPAHGWSDGRRVAVGVHGRPGTRRTPTLWNVAWAPVLFADGRAASLEAQALVPVQAAHEMGLSLDSLVARLAAVPAYRTAFGVAFPEHPRVTPEQVARALAVFQRTLVAPEAPFDRWVAGDTAAIAPPARRGFALFVGKARCAACHAGWAFTDGRFHDVGLPDADRGRGAVTGRAREAHAFRTPTLRDVAGRGPYMHDGSLPTLGAVVRHYQHGVRRGAGRARDVPRIALTPAEEADLLAFLATLSADAGR